MEEILKILDKLDKKENIYVLINKSANRAHQIMKNNSSSISGDMIDIVKETLKQILQNTTEKSK